MTHPWQYDETVQIGVDYVDPKQIEAYDQRMAKLRSIIAETEEIGISLRLSPDSTVWEIGTGTGECSLRLASKCRHIYATDISSLMLDYAREKSERLGIHNITYEVGGFFSGFQPERSVDGIVSQLALHHLPDFWKTKAINVVVKKLRPEGRLYLRDVVFPSEIEDYDLFFERIVEGIRSRAGDELAQETVQHIRAEYSTLDWILEGIIERSGLKIVNKENEGFIFVYVCEK